MIYPEYWPEACVAGERGGSSIHLRHQTQHRALYRYRLKPRIRRLLGACADVDDGGAEVDPAAPRWTDTLGL